MAYNCAAATDYGTFTKTFSSVTAFSMALLFKRSATVDSADTFLFSRSSSAVGLLCSQGTAGNTICSSWEDNEFNDNTGLNIVDGWHLLGMTAATGSPGSLKTYLGVLGSSTLGSYTNSHTMTAKSPSSWYISTDPITALNRNAAGDIAEIIMDDVVWGSDIFLQLLRGYTAPLVVPNAKFYAPLVRGLGDLKTGVAITANGSWAPSAHAPIIRPRHRWQPQAAATSPPPPPTAKLFRKNNLNGLGAGGPFFSDPLAAMRTD